MIAWSRLEAAPLWRYMAKDALTESQVRAVEQFRSAIDESEKQHHLRGTNTSTYFPLLTIRLARFALENIESSYHNIRQSVSAKVPGVRL